MINGAQIRAGRALLGWSMAELTAQSGVSASTIKRLEAAGRDVPAATVQSLVAIENALRKSGVTFIDENGGGSGVRFTQAASALSV
jgi:transcriptional regulator with XRE-family HTH domain